MFSKERKTTSYLVTVSLGATKWNTKLNNLNVGSPFSLI